MVFLHTFSADSFTECSMWVLQRIMWSSKTDGLIESFIVYLSQYIHVLSICRSICILEISPTFWKYIHEDDFYFIEQC